MNLSSIVHFSEELVEAIEKNPNPKLIYVADDGKRSLANAVFLMGAYLILKMHNSVAEVLDSFDWLDDSLVENFRNATYSKADFYLTLEVCCRGLELGVILGWFRSPERDDREMLGEINILEYRHYDSPANGDFHAAVPGRFIACKGPADLGGLAYADGDDGARTFSRPPTPTPSPTTSALRPWSSSTRSSTTPRPSPPAAPRAALPRLRPPAARRRRRLLPGRRSPPRRRRGGRRALPGRGRAEPARSSRCT